MQINKINTSSPNRLIKRNQNGRSNNNNGINNTNYMQNNQTSFKGAGLDKFCLGLANLIENGGLFVSFTLQDMLGTNLPRPIMGLMRNSKENKGKKNTSFAAKELVREMLTGPSMFLIPMAMLNVGKPLLGKTINVPMDQIKAFGNIHAANPNIASKEEFFTKAFTQILQNTKSEATASESTIKKASEFAKKLATSEKPKEVIGSLTDDFMDIAKQYTDDVAHADFTKAKLTKDTVVPFKDIVSSMSAYADDIIEKAKGKGAGFIKKLTNKKILQRLGTNLTMYAAVLAFLVLIPKLYNKAEGKHNAGLNGLMKQETLEDKSLEPKTQNTQNANNEQSSNPSFKGGMNTSQLVNTVTSHKGIGKFFRAFEFQGINVSFPMLLGIMGLGVLLPRTIQAKDKYDREEILRRDLVSCATMCFAEKELQKGFSKLNEAKSGFVLASKGADFDKKNAFQKLFEYLRPIKGVNVMSTEQIVSKYSGIDKYKEGIKGFCDFINGQGGNLSKVFSLTDESKNIVKTIVEKEGKDFATADNKTITTALNNAKDSAEVKKLIDMFKDKKNPWITKARTLNARFTALSVLVLVPVFLGFLLPAINERATKKRIREEQAAEEALKTDRFNDLLLKPDTKTSNIFREIGNF